MGEPLRTVDDVPRAAVTGTLRTDAGSGTSFRADTVIRRIRRSEHERWTLGINLCPLAFVERRRVRPCGRGPRLLVNARGARAHHGAHQSGLALTTGLQSIHLSSTGRLSPTQRDPPRPEWASVKWTMPGWSIRPVGDRAMRSWTAQNLGKMPRLRRPLWPVRARRRHWPRGSCGSGPIGSESSGTVPWRGEHTPQGFVESHQAVSLWQQDRPRPRPCRRPRPGLGPARPGRRSPSGRPATAARDPGWSWRCAPHDRARATRAPVARRRNRSRR